MFFVSQGRRKRIGLYAALLVFGFCVIRTTEFALRVFDDHVYCPAGFQGTGYWVIGESGLRCTSLIPSQGHIPFQPISYSSFLNYC